MGWRLPAPADRLDELRPCREAFGARVIDLPDPDTVHDELTWFFGPALSDIEPGSSYAAMVARLECGGKARAHRAPRQADTASDRRADALHAARVIHERLAKLSALKRWLLRELFVPGSAVDATWTEARAAIETYEDVRGNGPSVVPVNEEEV